MSSDQERPQVQHYAEALADGLNIDKKKLVEASSRANGGGIIGVMGAGLAGSLAASFPKLNAVTGGTPFADAAPAEPTKSVDKAKARAEDIEEIKTQTEETDKLLTGFRALRDNPTREAFAKAMDSLDRVSEQANVSQANIERYKKGIRKYIKPNEYGSGKRRPNKLSKPSKFFGNSRDIVYVETNKGVKPMTLKNAKKGGFI